MDDLDRSIVGALRNDARTSISSIASNLGVARATVQHRITRMENNGTIVGYTVKLKPGSGPNVIRAIMSIATEGNTAKAVVTRLSGSPNVSAVHSTNGKWDLIAEIQADSLAQFDSAINTIRDMKQITASETNLLLSTYSI
jgi:DNA-binding Lrp family transcriptional regulator